MRKETVGWEINKRLYLPTALSKSACVPHTQTNVLSGSSAHVMGLSDFKPADETRGGQENVVSGLQCVFCCSFAAVNWQQPSIVGLRSFPVVSCHKISGLDAFNASPAVFFGHVLSAFCGTKQVQVAAVTVPGVVELEASAKLCIDIIRRKRSCLVGMVKKKAWSVRLNDVFSLMLERDQKK